MRTKEYLLVLDTETCNSTEQPLPYDIGYAITDRQGNIYKTESFIVAETFLGMKDVMQSAYYAEKIPRYWDDIQNGTRIIKSLFNIRKQILSDMKEYNITKVGAYNMRFDRNALDAVIRYCSQSRIRWFFPYSTEFFCIWNMASTTILKQKTFFKYAEKFNWFSEKGNVKTSAEITYNYINRMNDFVESHTGLEDVLIEVEIMAMCYRQHKKMDKNISSSCWQKPNKVYREWKAIEK